MARSTAIARRPRGDLTRYDPQKGLKTIALAEAAVSHYARAKDATGLTKAIRLKLTEQAKFVEWWDTAAEKHTGARGDKRPNAERRSRSATALKAGTNGLPQRYTIDRWRQKLADPARFETAFQHASARYVRILEFQSIDAQLKASDSNEWYTPAQYLDAARRVLGAFDLDPASNPTANRDVQAERYFSIEDDGLSREWRGRIWLNPPYGGLSGAFVARLVEQFAAGLVVAAVLLVNSNSTDASWFQPLWNHLLCFTDHRINFISPDGPESGSTHGSVFVYFGSDRHAFIREFTPFGAVVQRASV
jgi:phage N-6-adenine-methyltransferase